MLSLDGAWIAGRSQGARRSQDGQEGVRRSQGSHEARKDREPLEALGALLDPPGSASFFLTPPNSS